MVVCASDRWQIRFRCAGGHERSNFLLQIRQEHFSPRNISTFCCSSHFLHEVRVYSRSALLESRHCAPALHCLGPLFSLRQQVVRLKRPPDSLAEVPANLLSAIKVRVRHDSERREGQHPCAEIAELEARKARAILKARDRQQMSYEQYN